MGGMWSKDKKPLVPSGLWTMRVFLIWLCLAGVSTRAQDTLVPPSLSSSLPPAVSPVFQDIFQSPATTLSPTEGPVDILDETRLEVCVRNLAAADGNGDEKLSGDEFRAFVRLYALESACERRTSLTVAQTLAFTTFACLCRTEPGNTFACCLPRNAAVSIPGSSGSPTIQETRALSALCIAIDLTLVNQCPPTLAPSNTDRVVPDEVTLIPTSVPSASVETNATAQPSSSVQPSTWHPTSSPSMTVVPSFEPTDFAALDETDLEVCLRHLVQADLNSDRSLNGEEFTDFVQSYVLETACVEVSSLSLVQATLFSTLACRCLTQLPIDLTCCLPRNMAVGVVGAREDDDPTTVQTRALSTICVRVAATVDDTCPVTTTIPSVSPTPSPTVMPTFSPESLIDCAQDLRNVDDGDETLGRTEFASLIAVRTGCEVTTLDVSQQLSFDSLACPCLFEAVPSQEVGDCCLANSTLVLPPLVEPTDSQLLELMAVCVAAEESTAPCFPTIQPTLSPSVEVNPDLINLNINECQQDMLAADVDGDMELTLDEFLLFVQAFGERMCNPQDTLNLIQQGAFSTLACACLVRPSEPLSCCLPANARINIEGADQEDLTNVQRARLFSICAATDATIQDQCPPGAGEEAAPTAAPLVSIDLDYCTDHMVTADANEDNRIDMEEYEIFVQGYGESECEDNDLGDNALSLQQRLLFYSLACTCLTLPDSGLDCCRPAEAAIPISGAGSPQVRTESEIRRLSTICLSTRTSIGVRCFEPPEPVAGPTRAPGGNTACIEHLLEADEDGDEELDVDEFLVFLQLLGDCPFWTELSVGQVSAFATLSCTCLLEPDRTLDCCIPAQARLNVQAASLPASDRTFLQQSHLLSVCSVSQATVWNDECQELSTEGPSGPPADMPFVPPNTVVPVNSIVTSTAMKWQPSLLTLQLVATAAALFFSA